MAAMTSHANDLLYIPPDSDFFKLSKHVHYLIKPISRSSFELKSLFISCEFNIPGVIAFCAFLGQLKNHYAVDSAIHLSYNEPLDIINEFIFHF